MPTLEHNGLVEMFRENPPLAAHLLTTLFHVDVPAHASVRIADSTLDQLLPVEFRADLVLELRDEKSTPCSRSCSKLSARRWRARSTRGPCTSPSRGPSGSARRSYSSS